LGVGFTTGAIDANTRYAPGDIRGSESRFAPENIQNNLELVKLLKTWADRKQATPGQVSLAWLLAQKPWIVPIPGTTQMAHMIENSAAGNVRFSNEEWKQFNQELAGITIKGLRLPQGILNLSNVEAPPKK
jgi:aryl-alcohol dehydrogenase-like predicted oxidoreductase